MMSESSHSFMIGSNSSCYLFSERVGHLLFCGLHSELLSVLLPGDKYNVTLFVSFYHGLRFCVKLALYEIVMCNRITWLSSEGQVRP